MDAIENIVRDIGDAQRAFMCVYVRKLFHDNGKLEEYEFRAPDYVDADMDVEACVHGLWCISDVVWSHYSEDEQVETMYFSHRDVMEYYRLCREYGKRFKVKLRDNLYMRAAADFVRDQLDQGCYACDYRLQTKINHEWASGIVFRMWPEFIWHFELLVLMNRIFDFYSKELIKLKKELGMNDSTADNGNDYLNREAA